MRIDVTEAATRIVRRVRDGGRTDLSLVLGTGCCDSTAPFLYDHYLVEPESRSVGEADGAPIFAPRWLADLYPGDSTLVLDVEEGVPNDSLSLESDHDCRFVLRVPARDAQR